MPGSRTSSRCEVWSMLFSTKKVLLVVSAFLAAACASASRNPVLDKYPPGVSGHTTITYYDVEGRTYQEVRADMRRQGPRIDGRTFFAEARSPMRWNWSIDRSGSTFCVLRNVTVSVNAQITLPRWKAPPDAEPSLVVEWRRFISALEKHEAGHKDISAKAGREIIRRLNGYSATCGLINARANEIARGIVERAAVEQREFDAATRHGINQGALFAAPVFRDST